MDVSEKLQKTQQSFPTSEYCYRASLVLHSVLQEEEQKIPLIKSQQEVTFFTTFVKSLKLSNLKFYFLKMSKDFYRLEGGREKYFQQSSEGFQNFGMTVSGRCLTQKISDCPRIGR